MTSLRRVVALCVVGSLLGLGVASAGTGIADAAKAINSLLMAPLVQTATPTAGHVLTMGSNGTIAFAAVSAAPSGSAGGDLGGTYPNPTVTSVADVTAGTLGIANGGTGLGTTPTDGQLLIGKTSTNAYVKAALTGTANQITVTNGSGAITLATPQSIGTGSSPTFAALTLTTGLTTKGCNFGIVTKSADYTLTTSDYAVLFDATATNRIATLPAISGVRGQVFVVKKLDASANTVTLTRSGSDTIDGATTQVISTRYASLTVQAPDTGTDWAIE